MNSSVFFVKNMSSEDVHEHLELHVFKWYRLDKKQDIQTLNQIHFPLKN